MTTSAATSLVQPDPSDDRFILEFSAPYAPDHLEPFYGQGHTTIATLHPVEPQPGDIRVLFTVNGEWDFEIVPIGGTSKMGIAGRYSNDPASITPEIEAIIADKCDCDEFEYSGAHYRFRRHENNWFEYFADIFSDDGWTEIDFSVAEEFVRGPQISEMLAGMRAYRDTLASVTRQ